MSLKVAQIRSSTEPTVQLIGSDSYQIRTDDASLEENFLDSYISFRWEDKKYYYVVCKIQLPTGIQALTIKPTLVSSVQDVLTQKLKNVWLPGAKTEGHELFLEMVVAPDTNEYDRLVFHIDHLATGFGGVITINSVQIYQIFNLIRASQLDITKIGIQGNPSLLTCINGQALRIGPSGILEISKVGNFSFDFIGIIPRTQDHWILDYQYNET